MLPEALVVTRHSGASLACDGGVSIRCGKRPLIDQSGQGRRLTNAPQARSALHLKADIGQRAMDVCLTAITGRFSVGFGLSAWSFVSFITLSSGFRRAYAKDRAVVIGLQLYDVDQRESSRLDDGANLFR